MNTAEKRRAYQNFFLKNEAGIAFMNQLTGLIDQNHRLGEVNPDLSRDYMQRCKGVREVIDHITSLTAERRAKAVSRVS